MIFKSLTVKATVVAKNTDSLLLLPARCQHLAYTLHLFDTVSQVEILDCFPVYAEHQTPSSEQDLLSTVKSC